MNLLLDENLPRRWIPVLVAGGHHAVHWLDIGSSGASDELLFQTAARRQAILVSCDLDFSRLVARYRSQLPSVIQIRDVPPLPEICGAELLSLLLEFEAPLRAGALVSFSLDRRLIRLLPIDPPDAARHSSE